MSDDSDSIDRTLRAIDLDLDVFRFIQTDAIYFYNIATIHTVDRTPVLAEEPDASAVREFCDIGRAALDIAGLARTDTSGRFRWRLSQFICEEESINVGRPVTFVATARASGAPAIMTHSLARQSEHELEIDVFSWAVDGSAQPGVRFDWRAWLVGGVTIVE